ncbi:MAG: hypothetical protein AB7Q45_27550, partial [Planctomycetaceae bacterium]
KTRLFLINLQSSLNYRSKDLRRYVTHLDAGQQRQFDRYGQAALLLIKMVAAQQRYIINYQIAASRSVIKEQPDVRLRAIEAMRDSLTAGASSAREALELLPDDPDIRSRFEEFDKLLRSMPPADR